MVKTATSAKTVEPVNVLEPYYIADAIRIKPAFTVKITPTKHTGTHPLAGERAEPPPTVTPLANPLVDASLQDGSSTAILPTIIHIPFTTINSGTAATIDGSGNLNFNVSGEGTVLLTQVVLLSGSTAPYNVYLVWTWGGRQTYLGKVQLPPDDGVNAWLITVNGLISIVAAQPLAINLATDDPNGHTLYWWQQDFQLGVPTSAFPSFHTISGLPPPLPAPGSDNAIPVPPISSGPVPMSVAGIPQPVFTYGSATAPPASAAFTQFTTTFPSPPLIINPAQNNNNPVWVAPTQPPPSQATTACVVISGNWGPPRGPALPSVVPPRTFMVSMTGDIDAEPEPPDEPAPAPDTPPPNGNGEVYEDESDDEGWFDDKQASKPTPPSKPKRKKK